MKRKKVLALVLATAMTFGNVVTAFGMDTDKYTDLKGNEDFYEYVEDMVDLKIMDGISDTEFGIEELTTREDVVSYMYRAMKSPTVNGSVTYSDVVGKDYADAVLFADSNSLFEGMREGFFVDGEFKADEEVSRSEIAKIMMNFAEKVLKIDVTKGAAESLDELEDAKDIQTEYVDAMKWAVGNKLLEVREDSETKILPNETINKVEIAEFLSKLLDMVEDETVDVVDKEDVQTVTKPNDNKKPVNNTKPFKPSTGNGKEENTSKPETKPEEEQGENEESKHEHKWVDKDHKEEGHWEDKLIKEAWEETIEHEEEGHMETVVDEEAWTEEIPMKPELGHSEWVVDKEAWDEQVLVSPEEGHYENGDLISPEEGHYENGDLISPEEGHTETIHHPAVTEKQWIVDKEAWTETVNHPEQGHYETVVDKPAWKEEVTVVKQVCHNCGFIITSNEAWVKHSMENINCSSYGSKEFTEYIDHPAETHEEWVVDKEAWTETINHPEQGHYEDVVVKEAWDEEKWVVDKPAVYEQVWVVDKEAVYEQVWVVDKEAVYETVHHDAEGHFEWVVDQEGTTDIIEHPAKTHEEWVVDKKAWTEVIKHDAEYEKVWVVDKEAWTETVCSECGEKKNK